ncbi:MAG: hypothetical protein COA71_12970 [SAR86 cluster bacterium]|uniref:Major facilitator superfamily (MFS) profile domain-containing protein n=1 Tax=SAR86 cluster bacterium TaxID=2030880 RepID=A0A2A5C7R0_9GAMM|nr:MFS transporter [Gammaproteobacteria bacterium AH-315-E17]PCJ39793.1 MAG: hypothetical protein COA71_12970 [SAR86 cluster bacterium]
MSMFKNTKFRNHSLPIIILGIFMMYFYSALQNDHLNILTPYYTDMGWSANQVTLPVTVAGFVVIFLTMIIGTLMIKYGVAKVLIPSTVLLGISTIGLAVSGDNMVLYAISLFMMRVLVVPLLMGAFMLCTNWFVNLRGRVLGFITMGNPLCTATIIPGMSIGVASIGFTATYTIIGVAVILLALLMALFIKSRPEDYGLYPDGSATPVTIPVEKVMSFKDVMTNKNSWLLIVSFGLLQFMIVALMAFYVPRMQMIGTEMPTLLFWLSVAAIMGMPISYLIGFIDDKLGTITASLVMCCFYFLALFMLLFMQADNIAMIIALAIGLAGVTGGMPTLHPSVTAYVFGRENYQAANRWIMSIQAVIMAFAITFMATIMDTTGSLDLAYQIMLGMMVVVIITILMLSRTPDYDRETNKVLTS